MIESGVGRIRSSNTQEKEDSSMWDILGPILGTVAVIAVLYIIVRVDMKEAKEEEEAFTNMDLKRIDTQRNGHIR